MGEFKIGPRFRLYLEGGLSKYLVCRLIRTLKGIPNRSHDTYKYLYSSIKQLLTRSPPDPPVGLRLRV